MIIKNKERNKRIAIFYTVTLLIILIICLLLVRVKAYYSIDNQQVQVSKVEPIEEKIEVKQIVLDKEKCKYSFNQETSKIKLEEYSGDEDCIIIPKELNGYKIESINSEAFLNCYNLEKIKIEKELASEIVSIENFEISKETEENEYVEYVTTKEYNDSYLYYISLTPEEKAKQEIIPAKFNVPLDEVYSAKMEEVYEVSQLEEEQIPSNYDLRDYIDIKVENQKTFGTCYAYALLSSIETNLSLKKQENMDLSEIHLSTMTSGRGGNFHVADSYFESKLGPVFEEDWSMEEIYGNTTPNNFNIINRVLTGATVTEEELQQIKEEMSTTNEVAYNIQTIDMPSILKNTEEERNQKDAIEATRKVIKKHIMEYGSLYASICSDNYYTYQGNTVMNNPPGSKVTHAVSVIGWDDNFSKYNFPIGCRPQNDGAYLVLNSWGNTFGDNGYLWISYEDATVEKNLCGVTSVDISGQMNIKNVETNEEIENDRILQGDNIQIGVNINVDNLLNNADEAQVKLRNCSNDYTEQVSISKEITQDNELQVLIDMETQKFSTGSYIIEIICGEEITSKYIEILPNIKTSDIFKYIVNEDGQSITIIEYIGNEKNVEIPKEYLGYKVTGIGESAFYSKLDLESVTVHENVTNIGYSIVRKGVILSGNEGTEIQKYAEQKEYQFVKIGQESIENDYCYFDLKNHKLYVTAQIGDYSQQSDVPWAYFRNSIHEVELPESITEIKKYAFTGCRNLTSIKIPEAVTSIGDDAFHRCNSLQNLDIPGGVTTIGNRAFYQCYSLQSIEMPENLTNIGNGVFNEAVLNILIKSEASSTEKEIDLPNIIKNAKSEGATLDFRNCELSEDGSKLRANLSSLSDNSDIRISVLDGTFGGFEVLFNAEIIPASEISITSDLNKIYDGNEIEEPTYTKVGDGEVSIEWYKIEGEEKTETKLSEKPKNAGTYKVKVIITGTSNYSQAEAEQEFTINKATPEYTKPANLTAVEGQKLADIELPNNFSWEAETNTSVGEIGENTFTVKYTPEDTENYSEVTGIEVQILVETKEDSVTSEIYDINETEMYIRKIPIGTKLSDFKKDIKANNSIVVYKNENEISDTEALATGMILAYGNSRYTIIVSGDVDGNAKVTINDLALVRKNILKTFEITVEQKIAMDLDYNQKVTINDLALMRKMILNKE